MRSRDPIAAGQKDMPLEALRGLAAVTVLLWHCMLGFFPQGSGVFPDQFPAQAALNGQIWFGLINGNAAVTLFFVLSGYVLSRRFLLTGEQQMILRGAIKRWPRLLGPVLVTVLVSWSLFKLGAYRFAEGGAVTGSPWLSRFAYAFRVPFEPNLLEAFLQGAFTTFFKGDSSYDSSLWTMRFEFIGSFIVFALAMLLSLVPSRGVWIRIFFIIGAFFLCSISQPFYATFPVGVALAAFLPEPRRTLPAWSVFGLILVALYLFGFTGVSVGAFAPLSSVFGSTAPVIVHIIASAMIVAAVECAPIGVRHRWSGRAAACLGTLSFPLYLVHILVLCSFGCAVLLWARQWAGGPYPAIMACVATILGSVLASLPLVVFNEWWVRIVNKGTNRLMAPPSGAGGCSAKADCEKSKDATVSV